MQIYRERFFIYSPNIYPSASLGGWPSILEDDFVYANWTETGIGVGYRIKNRNIKNRSIVTNKDSGIISIETFAGMNKPVYDSFSTNINKKDKGYYRISLPIFYGKNLGLKIVYSDLFSFHPYVKYEYKQFEDSASEPKLLYGRFFKWTYANKYPRWIENFISSRRDYSMKVFSLGTQYNIFEQPYVKSYIFGEISLNKFRAHGAVEGEIYKEFSILYDIESMNFKGSYNMESTYKLGNGYGLGLIVGNERLSGVLEIKMSFVRTDRDKYSNEYLVTDNANGNKHEGTLIPQIDQYKGYNINTLEATIGIRYAVPNFLNKLPYFK